MARMRADRLFVFVQPSMILMKYSLERGPSNSQK